MIVEHTQESKSIARQNLNYYENRKSIYTLAQLEHALDMLESHSYNQVTQETDISKNTLIRAMKKRKREDVVQDSK